MTDPTSPTTLPVTADPRRAAGLGLVRRQVLAGSTGLTVETRADEAAATDLLLAAAADGDEAAQATVTTLGQLPRAWAELRARVPVSLPGEGTLVDTPDFAGSQPLAGTRPRSQTSLGQSPAGTVA